MTPVKTNAVIYQGGASHGFPIGSTVPLPDNHAEDLHKSGHVVIGDRKDLDPPGLKALALKDK